MKRLKSGWNIESFAVLVVCALNVCAAETPDANRLTHLDDKSPFWPSPKTARFSTPQWVGEPGVEAVVVLAIDDMRDRNNKPGSLTYETFLRPILERLKRIDGRAPVSIMTNSVAQNDPRFADWLREGLSLEIHTLTHPCPFFGKAPFEESARTYHGGVDLMAGIQGNKPVAFRMPCCDSMNSASPRFFSEIFSMASPNGNWLAIDSSVFTLPPGERYSKYFPLEMKPPMKIALDRYAGFIDDYPYPYVIGNVCWEFPCMVPSDWEAFNILGSQSATVLEDWKAGLDYVVKKQGVFTAVFHPHGWSSPKQWVEFIDYAEAAYGKKIKFLNFREALERLEKHALAGHSLRATDGNERQVRLLDVNGDGQMDVVIGAADKQLTRVWDAKEARWKETPTPVELNGANFGIVRDGAVSLIVKSGGWTFGDGAWQRDDALLAGLEKAATSGRLLRDFDKDGSCEMLANQELFAWHPKDKRWHPANFKLPADCAVLDAQGRDNGLRFVDLNGDGFDDVIQSNDAGFGIFLWAGTVKANLGWNRGWPHLVAKGPAVGSLREGKVLPFVKAGRDFGAWFHRDAITWQNEAVATPSAESVARSFKSIIALDVPAMKTPRESLEALKPRPGFTAELVAAEPMIESPVNFDWDAQGRLWVVEMPDYPLGMDGKGKPGGRVKILTDNDGDGQYEKVTTFLDELPFPSGIMPWRNGVLIASAPNIFFAADTNGDGRADERRVLFTGFKEGNQQHRLNGFAWGLDGWIYGANGDSGGVINGVSISGRDFRFRPDSGEFEAESGQTQYGRVRDDWGNWFGNNNPVWLWHYTIEDRYLRRNPKLAVRTTRQMLANYPDSTRVFPASETTIRFNQPQAAGHVTSGCSPCAYRDELFGAAFATSVFECEPVHNVVHREILEPDGATFTSHRADDEKDREFLASTDPRFRPVMAKTGPDGALYVADFHRFVLEHPEWIAPETQSRVDLRGGAERGRIYRIIPAGAKLRSVPNLDKLDNAALAAALDSPNGWQRDTVQRLLFERNATDAAPALRRLVVKSENPKVRMQAVASLSVLKALQPDELRAALHDAHAGVRVQALRAAESAALPSEDAVRLIAECIDDPNLGVRYQLALSLGAFRVDRAATALEVLAERDGANALMRVAIQSSLLPSSTLFSKLNKAAAPALPAAVALPKPSTPDRAKVIAGFSTVSNLNGDAEKGHKLFTRNCVNCHRLKDEGHEVGPNLEMVSDKPIEWLLTAIFDPNAAIEARYQAQSVKLKSGEVITGIISAETANNLVLRLPGGTDFPVLREDIVKQKASGVSLMPDGMETVLTPQDVADLIRYLRKSK